MMIYIPFGVMNAESDDEGAARRRQLAEALRRGEQISVTPSGEVLTQDERDANPDEVSIVVPDGKLA